MNFLQRVLRMGAGLIVVLGIAALSYAEEEPWRKAKEADGITVYTRLAADSRFKEFKGVSIIEEPLDVLMMVLNDIASFPEWMADCMEARMIEAVDERTMVTYVAQGMPWPVRNREIVIRTVEDDALATEGYMSIRTRAIEDERVGVRKGFVRITDMEGEWRLAYLGPHRTQVTYWTKADPAGAIPPMIVNMTCTKIPYVSLSGLRKMAQQERYRTMAEGSALRARMQAMIQEGALQE